MSWQVVLAKLLLEVIMKFSDILKGSDPAPTFVPETVLVDTAMPQLGPFDYLEEHLAKLIAVETAARAAHDKAVDDLKTYYATLDQLVETHKKSFAALYEKSSKAVSKE